MFIEQEFIDLFKISSLGEHSVFGMCKLLRKKQEVKSISYGLLKLATYFDINVVVVLFLQSNGILTRLYIIYFIVRNRGIEGL